MPAAGLPRERGWEPHVLRLAGIATGAGSLVWAVTVGASRNAAGEITAAICLPLACAVAGALVAAASSRPSRYAAAWLALALVGQAASLQMIDAGRGVRYQHYLPLRTLSATHPWLLAIVAVQAIAVSTAIVRRLRGRMTNALGPRAWRIAAAALLSASTAATVSPSVARYVTELAFAASLQILAMATLVVMVLALPDGTVASVGRWLDRLLGGEADEPSTRPDLFAWSAAAAAMLLATALNVFSYERHPHLPDEVADLYHARYFAEGMLTMPAPPSVDGFNLDLMTYQPDRWFSPVAPGWPAVLAVGAFAGVPWLVNPLLAGVDVLLASLLLGRLYPRRVARCATALLAVSPWFLFLGMSFMTHTSTLALGLGAALALDRARRDDSPAWSLLSGALVGAASIVRPLDGLLIGTLMMAWAALGGGARLRRMVMLGGAAAAVGALILPYNAHLIGNPFQFPLNAYLDAQYHPNANAYGFGPDRGMGWPIDPNIGHSPLDGLINTNLNAFALNTDLFGWSIGSLAFAALLLCAGRPSRADWLMLSVIALVLVAHFFYYFSGGPDFGARYWFLIVVPLVALTARGIAVAEGMAGARVGAAVIALVVMTLVAYIPWRAVDKYYHYRGMRADVRRLAAEHGFGRDLVLVSGRRLPDYSSAAAENPVDLRSGATVYAWDRSPEVRAELLRAFPDRRVWLLDGPSVTGSGYRISGGPVAATSLMPGTP